MQRHLAPITPCNSLHYPSPSSARHNAYSAVMSCALPPTEIIPRLYISDLSAAENASTLLSLGITHVVSAMRGRVLFPKGIALQHLQLPLEDSPFAELASLLPSSTAFLTNALRDPNARIIVHCAQGISRSTSVVCGFLVAAYGWTPEQALQYVKSKHKFADPNPGFVSQIGEYAATLRKVPR